MSLIPTDTHCSSYNIGSLKSMKKAEEEQEQQVYKGYMGTVNRLDYHSVTAEAINEKTSRKLAMKTSKITL